MANKTKKKETEFNILLQKNLEELEKIKIESQLLREKLQNEHNILITEARNNLNLNIKRNF